MIMMIHNIKNFIKNCIKYRRLLWEDRWFDSHHVFMMLREKLRNDAVGYNSEQAVSTGSEDIAKQIDRCVALLDKIIDDEYELEEYSKVDAKWGEASFNWDKKTEDGIHIMEINRPLVKTDEDGEEMRQDMLASMEVSHRRKQKDISNLFDYMKLHISKWWD